MLRPEMSVDAICVLFGKTRQAYYQRLGYQYQASAEESIVLEMILEYRSYMGKMGGRKLWHEINRRLPSGIGRDKLFDILDKYHLKVNKRRRSVRTTWSESWLHRFPNLVKDQVITAANQV